MRLSIRNTALTATITGAILALAGPGWADAPKRADQELERPLGEKVGRVYFEDATRIDRELVGRTCDEGLECGTSQWDDTRTLGEGEPLQSDDLGSIPKGLTGFRSWAPTGAVDFKTAAACAFPRDDWYGVFAVYEMENGRDELWYLRVDGMSTYSNYGKIVGTRRIARENIIHSVDCASDDDNTVYVTWDRSESADRHLNAQWSSITPWGAPTGPYEIPKCRNWQGYDTLQSWAPSIAYHDGVVATAYAGRFSCSWCWSVWDTAGRHLGSDAAWGGDGHAEDTAIEWNGYDAFLMAVLYPQDGGNTSVYTLLTRPDASLKFTELGWIDGAEVGRTVKGVDLVFSNNSRNGYKRMLADTSLGTVWVNRLDGTRVGDRVTAPVYGQVNCEYWGPRTRIANSFGVPSLSKFASGFNWRRSSSAPAEMASLADYPFTWPAACSSSDSFDDPEVLLVRGSVLGGWNERVYVNFEPED